MYIIDVCKCASKVYNDLTTDETIAEVLLQ